MIISSRQKLSKITIEPEIRIGETAIKRVRNSKTLGVLIDEHLTWDGQLENVQSPWAYRPIFFRGAVGNLPDCQENCPTSFLTLLLIVV